MCEKIKFKNKLLSVLLFIFFKAFVFLYKEDDEFIERISKLPDKFVFCIKIKFSDFNLCIKKDGKTISKVDDEEVSDLDLIFINPCSALLVFSGFISQTKAFSERRVFLKGEIAYSLILVSAIERLQEVVFPSLIVRRLKKSGRFKKSKSDLWKMLKFYSTRSVL